MEGKTAPPGGRLLIIDDAEGLRDVLAIKLARAGYAVATAQGARDASAQLAQGGFDLILLDLRLPDGDGFELLSRLRATHSALDLPVIIISGLGDTRDVVKALEMGANDYVTKPFDLGIVLARVHTQLDLRRLKQAHDHFLRVASHDLKRPLVLMLDVGRRLMADYRVGQVVDQGMISAVSLLVESGDFMQRIIVDLLELRAVRDGRLRLTRSRADLGALVRQAIAHNTHYAQSKGIALDMQFGKDMPLILVDELRILQVLENLIGNAIKFGPPGTQVVVSTRCEDGALICEVSDNGPGIPEADMDKLFVEYAQLSNRPTGNEKSTGLGLAISRELVQLHGGRIGARNNTQGGAAFWFSLPIPDAPKPRF